MRHLRPAFDKPDDSHHQRRPLSVSHLPEKAKEPCLNLSHNGAAAFPLLAFVRKRPYFVL